MTVYLRRGLFVVGVALLLWWPVSYFYFVWFGSPLASRALYAGPLQGTLLVIVSDAPSQPAQLSADVERVNHTLPTVPSQIQPSVERVQQLPTGAFETTIFIPLYLLAAICLAWPVTSFFLHRRRQGRGFPVETVEGMNAEG